MLVFGGVDAAGGVDDAAGGGDWVKRLGNYDRNLVGETEEQREGGRQQTRTFHRMLDHHELEGRQLCEPLVLRIVLFLGFEKVVETVDDAGATAGGVEEAVAGVRFRKGTILAMREIEGYVHMRNTAIRLVIGVDGQEVRIDRSHILASGLCDHGLQRLKTPLVALEGEQLQQAPSAFPGLIATSLHTLPLFPISALK